MYKRLYPSVLLTAPIIGLLLLSLPACQKVPTKTSKGSLFAENVLFFEDGKLFVNDVKSARTRELCAVKYPHATIGFAKYFVAANTVIYEINKIGAPRPAPELRAYSLESNQNTPVDTDVQVVASDDKGLVLYTKMSGVDQGKLWRYDIRSGKRPTDSTNTATGILNKNSTELFHHSFVPPTEPIPKPQALYITNIASGKQEMVVVEQPGKDVFPLRITATAAVYIKTQGENGLSDIYRFDRATKKHRLLADNVWCYSNEPGTDNIVAVRATDTAFKSMQVIEISPDATLPSVLYDRKLPNPSIGYHAFLAPASRAILSMNEPNKLNLYNYKTQKSYSLVASNETVTGIQLSPDQKSLIVMINTMKKPSTDPYEGLYRIDLTTGKRSLIHGVSLTKRAISQPQILDVFAASR
ncbi:MAG: hypothetical protein ACYC56_07275 [Candidatus Aquicultor sp.]